MTPSALTLLINGILILVGIVLTAIMLRMGAIHDYNYGVSDVQRPLRRYIIIILQRLAQNRVSRLAWWGAFALVVAIPFCLMWVGEATAEDVGDGASPTAAGSSGAPPRVPRPLRDEERSRLVRDYQTEPEASPDWEISARSRSLTIHRSAGQPREVFVMNAGYAAAVMYEVTAGNFGSGAEYPLCLVESPNDRGDQLHGTAGLYHGEKNTYRLTQPAALHARWDHPPYRGDDPAKNLGLYFSALQDPAQAAVIRTQGKLSPGTPVAWGTFPTHYGEKPLQVEGTIVFLDQQGQYLVASTMAAAPQIWALPPGAEELRGEYRAVCSTPLHPLRITDPESLARHRLWVMMPTGGYCLVNWKVTGIVE